MSRLESVSAQASEGSPISREDSEHSSFGFEPQRRFSNGLIESFDVNTSPSISDLCEVQIELDYRCLQIAAAPTPNPLGHATSNVNSVVRLATFLSGSLNLARFPGSFLYQEIQLRSLTSSLALLHHYHVESLYPEQWDTLQQTNIPRIYRNIAFQLTSSQTLSNRITHASNKYLVQLASQYLSLIRRGDSVLPSLAGPIVKVFFACLSLAGQQYNQLRDILEGLGQLVSLWQSSETKYRALCGIQEYTRLASALFREANKSLQHVQARRLASVIVSKVLRKIDDILAIETRTPLPRLGGAVARIRTVVSLGPPNLHRGYYLYGLLDCAAQLATLGELDMLRAPFVGRLRAIICTDDVPEYRWKCIEILLSCHHSREVQVNVLRNDIKRGAKPVLRQETLEAVSIIRGLLDSLDCDVEAEFRQCVTQPLQYTSEALLFDPLSQAASLNTGPIDQRPGETSDTLSIEPCSPRGDPIPQTTSPTINPVYHENNIPLPRSRPKDPKMDLISLPRGRFSGRIKPECADIAYDCRHAFFYDDYSLSVFSLSDVEEQSSLPKNANVLTVGKLELDGQAIFDAVISRTMLIVATGNRLLIFDIANRIHLTTTDIGGWGPAGLACRENSTRLIVALGQACGNTTATSRGSISIYTYALKDNVMQLIEEPFVIMLPPQSCPKRVSLSADARTLICVTAIQNKVLIWDLSERSETSTEPFEFVKNHYRVETSVTGITCTSIYSSPSYHKYLLCTTSPSTERGSDPNQGEWSFILPIPEVGTMRNAPQPPADAVYDFHQFKNHRPLRAGAVSNKHHVFAVLEETGKISILPLRAGEKGGICGIRGDVQYLTKALNSASSALRFDPDGERLFAVDAQGRILITEFERR